MMNLNQQSGNGPTYCVKKYNLQMSKKITCKIIQIGYNVFLGEQLMVLPN